MRKVILLVLAVSLMSFTAMGADGETDRVEVKAAGDKVVRAEAAASQMQNLAEAQKEKLQELKQRRMRELEDVRVERSGEREGVRAEEALRDRMQGARAEEKEGREEQVMDLRLRRQAEMREREVIMRERGVMEKGEQNMMRQREATERERDAQVRIREGEQNRDPNIQRDQPRSRIAPDLADFAQKEFPFLLEGLRELSGNPLRNSREMEEIQNHLKGLIELRKENPDAYQREKRVMNLEHNTLVLAEKVRLVHDPKAKEELTRELANTLEELFEMKQQARRHEMEMIEKELQERRKQFETRQARRSEIIRGRLNELTGANDALGWE